MSINIKTEKLLSPSNIRKIIELGISLKDSISAIEQKCIEEYNPDKNYLKDSYFTHNGYLYKAKTVITGEFNENKVEKIGDELSLIDLQTIKNMINMSDEEIANLQSLISTEIRLDKVFSSSDTYNRILNATNECKTYTMEQIAKKAGVVYKIVDDTTGVDSTEFLYLISNGSGGYNIYAYIDGSAVKISDTNINLDGYAKLTDLDDYLKKTDADGKYALITTVNGKVDKTSILSAISSTPSDDKLLSEKAIDDTFVKKTDITTSIDSTSTDTELPTAKSVWDNIKNKNTMQPSGTMAKYSTVFDWAVNNAGATCPYEGNNLADCPLKNTWGTLVCIGIKTENGLKVLACSNFNENIYIRTILRRNGTNEWVEPKWKRLCSTSVDDVPITYINKFENETYVKPSDTNVCSYYVTNGHCIIRLETVCLSTAQNFVQLVSGLPKPKDGLFSNVIDRQMESNSGARGIFHLLPSGILRVVCNYGDSSVTEPRKFYATFSYPVAES